MYVFDRLLLCYIYNAFNEFQIYILRGKNCSIRDYRNIWGFFYSDCSENIYEITNCSLLNQSMIYHEQLVNHSCSSVLLNCTSHPEMEHRLAATCISTLRGIVGDLAFSNATFLSSRNLTSPSEEYF